MDPSECLCEDDVYLHLVSWLQWVDHPQPVMGEWKQVLGFRRAMCNTSIWKHADGRYGMHASDEIMVEGHGFNLGTANNLQGILAQASKTYARVWKRRNPGIPPGAYSISSPSSTDASAAVLI